MTRIMYDAITPSRIPAVKPQLVASYVNGEWPNFNQLKKLFPNSIHVSIAVNILGVANVLDVERFDAAPTQAPAWVTKMRALGRDPSVYMNMSTWPAVIDAFKQQGVKQPHYWVADYGPNRNIPVGAHALQFLNTPGYDVSVVADYWPGIDAPEDDMPTAQEIADAILNKVVETKTYDGKPVKATIQSYIVNSDLHGAAILQLLEKIEAALRKS